MSEFDKVTHIINKKGQLISTNHYKLKIENGQRKFERPIGSNQWFWENGEPVNKPAPEKPAEVTAPAPTPEQEPAKAAQGKKEPGK